MVLLWIYLAGVVVVSGGLTKLLARIDGGNLDRRTAAVIAAFSLTWPGSIPAAAAANVLREASIVNRYWFWLLVVMLIGVTVVSSLDLVHGDLARAELLAARGFGLVTIIAVGLLLFGRGDSR